MKTVLPTAVLATLVLSACTIAPSPLSVSETQERVASDRASLFDNQDPVSGAISLSEATARALKYNLDRRLKLMEEAVAAKELDVAHYSLLPSLAANAGYTTRNKADASVSENLDTGVRGGRNTASFSSDPDSVSSGLQVAWNVLDFGVSYYQAKQRADNRMIAAERRRQVIHNIVSDVRRSYWRAVAAERLLDQLDPLLEKVRGALEASEALERSRVTQPLDQLTYQRSLLETFNQLVALRRDMMAARSELSVLMNLHPGTKFRLADSDLAVNARAPLPDIPMSLEEMETVALTNRAELRSQDYQQRIDRTEARVALLRMLPGLELSTGYNYSNDSYLVYDSWATSGLSVTWNLLQVLSGPTRIEQAEAQETVTKTRRLALSMAVISQVHIANVRYEAAREAAKVGARLSDVEGRIRDQLARQRQARTNGALGEIDAEVRARFADLRADLAYAEAQAALGAVYASLGAEPLPDGLTDHSLTAVSQAVRDTLERWSAGTVDLAVTGLDDAAASSVAPEQAGEPAPEPVQEDQISDAAPSFDLFAWLAEKFQAAASEEGNGR